MILDIMAVPLSQGLHALVDGEDFEWLNQWGWYANKNGNNYYAVRHITVNNKRKMIWMHREIVNIPIGFETDHINHNGLDNRKQNLRACTHGQNIHYQRVQQGKTSKYKGVHWSQGKWVAQTKNKGHLLYLGRFKSEIEAARAYDTKAKELFGEFAYTNFPQ